MLKINCMKRHLLVALLSLVFFAGKIEAQAVSQDSIKLLNNEKDRLKVSKSLNDKKLKLAELENKVAAREADVQRTAAESQKAVEDNQAAANALSNDATDKSKLSAAKKAGNRADSKASDARKAVNKLNDLKEDIENQRKKIQQDEQKLVALGGTVAPVMSSTQPATIVSDSIKVQQ